MLPYISILIFLMLWIIIEKEAINRKSFWIPLFTLSTFSGIRSYRVGTDSWAYTKPFRDNISVYNYSFNENVEYGYQLFEYILLNSTHNYFWVFFISTAFITSIYIKTIKDYSSSYLLAMYFFITLGSYTFGFNVLRQAIAISICLLSLPYLLNRKFLKFIMVILLACLFHISAIIFIPFYFIVHLRVKIIYKIFITFFSSFALSRLFIYYLAANNPRYGLYTETYTKGNGYLTLSFYVAIIILLYAVMRIYKIKDELFIKLFTLYATGVVLVIPIALLGTDPSGPQRVIYFFTWTLILLLPLALKKINSIVISISAIIISFIYFILTTTTFASLIPYTINPMFKVL